MVSGRIDYHRLSHTTRAFGIQGKGGGEFNMPWGVAIDNEREYVIVTDTGNHRVQVSIVIIISVAFNDSTTFCHLCKTRISDLLS